MLQKSRAGTCHSLLSTFESRRERERRLIFAIVRDGSTLLSNDTVQHGHRFCNSTPCQRLFVASNERTNTVRFRGDQHRVYS